MDSDVEDEEGAGAEGDSDDGELGGDSDDEDDEDGDGALHAAAAVGEEEGKRCPPFACSLQLWRRSPAGGSGWSPAGLFEGVVTVKRGLLNPTPLAAGLVGTRATDPATGAEQLP
jgi:hypothetical protein